MRWQHHNFFLQPRSLVNRFNYGLMQLVVIQTPSPSAANHKKCDSQNNWIKKQEEKNNSSKYLKATPSQKRECIGIDSTGFGVGNRKLKWMLSSDSIMSNSRGITKENNGIDSPAATAVIAFGMGPRRGRQCAVSGAKKDMQLIWSDLLSIAMPTSAPLYARSFTQIFFPPVLFTFNRSAIFRFSFSV